jgi:glutathione S-transferase
MKLWFAPTSPFARKVRIAAHELGLAGSLTFEAINPWTDRRLRDLNPLAKVPTLELDDGEVLYESAVIVAYLDAQARGGLIPQDDAARWRALRLQGLCDGVATAAGRIFAGERRGVPDPIEARLVEATQAGLNAIDAGPLDFVQPQVGDIAAAATLSYFDFRWPDRDWRCTRTRAGAFLAEMEKRPSMIETAYHPL